MPLRVSNLRLPVEEPDDALPTHLARALGVPVLDIGSWRVLRKALDLREIRQRCGSSTTARSNSRGRTRRSCGRSRQFPSRSQRLKRYSEPPFAMPEPGSTPLPHRPVVVGSGPAAGCRRVLPRAARLPAAAPGTRHEGQGPHPRREGVRRRRRRSTPRATTSSAKAGPARSPTASSPAAAPGRTCMRVLELLAECKGHSRASRAFSTTTARTSAATACRPS